MLGVIFLIFFVPTLIAWSPIFAFAYWLRPMRGVVPQHVWVLGWLSVSLLTVLLLGLSGVIKEFLSWQ